MLSPWHVQLKKSNHVLQIYYFEWNEMWPNNYHSQKLFQTPNKDNEHLKTSISEKEEAKEGEVYKNQAQFHLHLNPRL